MYVCMNSDEQMNEIKRALVCLKLCFYHQLVSYPVFNKCLSLLMTAQSNTLT